MQRGETEDSKLLQWEKRVLLSWRCLMTTKTRDTEQAEPAVCCWDGTRIPVQPERVEIRLPSSSLSLLSLTQGPQDIKMTEKGKVLVE